MHKHHDKSIKNFIDKHKHNDDIIAIILAGSLAKGEEKKGSDIDLLVIVTQKLYAELKQANKLSECVFSGCTYDNGYFDIKYFTKDFLKKAKEKGSEPTRNSFIGAKCIYSIDDEIEKIISEIPAYPEWQKDDKIFSFYSTLKINNDYFWPEAVKAKDNYLKVRTASEIVLFGMRMLYAFNHQIFPCHKGLLKNAKNLKQKPDDIIEKANLFLEKLDTASKDEFVNSILSFCEWDINQDYSASLTRFILDNEQWWYNNSPNIAEW